MKRQMVKIGETYGKLKIMSVFSKGGNGQLKRYNCKCIDCGSEFIRNGQSILAMKPNACPSCRKSEHEKEYAKKCNSYIGQIFNNIKIIGYAGKKKTHKNDRPYTPFMICECLNCGGIFETPLKRVLCGEIKQCKNCGKKNLQLGYEIMKKDKVFGTSITMINRNEKKNKNNSTGINGVSRVKKNWKI